MSRKPLMKVGDTFTTNKSGELAVVEYFNKSKVHVRFFDTGYETFSTATDIRKGEVKDPLAASVLGVGCIGIGVFKTSYMKDGKLKQSPLYQLWQNMLKRCYDPKYHARKPTYKGCTVCDEWLNFQNFCYSVKSVDGYDQWSDYQIGIIDTPYELDKDKLVDGNKHYSPSTCCFITKTENVQLSHLN